MRRNAVFGENYSDGKFVSPIQPETYEAYEAKRGPYYWTVSVPETYEAYDEAYRILRRKSSDKICVTHRVRRIYTENSP